MMDELERTFSLLDYILDTPKKRHLAGGILLSMSMLFTGLALTVMTIRNEEHSRKDESNERYQERGENEEDDEQDE